MGNVEHYLREWRGEIEHHLTARLQPEQGLPASLLEAMRYSLLAPGKRLRPLLVLLAGEACREGANPWPAACAIEMVHVYSLIHDDLPAMDDDDLRRGQPTCHRKFGEALAILAGDALLTLAFQTVAEGYPSRTGALVCGELARAAGQAGMVGGQVDDLAMEQAKDLPRGERALEMLEQIHLRKTGALIRAALKMGAIVAHDGEPPAEVVTSLDTYGRCLGLAFQITDDLLDVEGRAEHTGKAVNKDAARGKLTYPGLLGIEESRRRACDLGRIASESLAPLGTKAGRLLELFSFVLSRDR